MEAFRIYLKKHKVRILTLVVIFITILGSYLYVVSYLEEVIHGNVMDDTIDTERSVTGDEIALTYTKQNGVVVSYSAQRTQTEDDVDIIQSYAPRLVYHFADSTRDPIHIRADFGEYEQKAKVITFQSNVILRYGSIVVKGPIATLIIDDDMVLFPQGALVEDNSTIKAISVEWNIESNVIQMKEPTIYIGL